jgi:hypothetical protein
MPEEVIQEPNLKEEFEQLVANGRTEYYFPAKYPPGFQRV